MGKAAESSTTKEEKVRQAKRAFFMNLFDLSWRMLAAMLAPLFVGMYIDSNRSGGQGFTTAGFFVGMVGGVFVLRDIVRKLSKGVDS
jgi:F0F1-type ATP synthase assembly protein I